MKWLRSIFKKKKEKAPAMPPYDEIVKALYDKDLDYSDSLKICKVIYSKDKSKRFVVLASDKGFFRYTYEEICVLDKIDWNSYYDYGYPGNIKPGWWEPKDRFCSFFWYRRRDFDCVEI
ncbi:MAG: hypothetical protein IJY65_00340 [Clostridia bacterium]|nr:hypothetical protein [Clostridia bacterium]